jgi:hypothetical protein
MASAARISVSLAHADAGSSGCVARAAAWIRSHSSSERAMGRRRVRARRGAAILIPSLPSKSATSGRADDLPPITRDLGGIEVYIFYEEVILPSLFSA